MSLIQGARLLALGSLFAVGCGCAESRYGYACGTFDRYTIGATQVSDGGVTYDLSGQSVPPGDIDRRLNEVEDCLDRDIDRSSFVVKVAPDWHLGCDEPGWGVSQLLPVPSPPSGCEAKGMNPTAQCPCEYRAGITGDGVLVVTPDLKLFKDVLIRRTLGVSDPWTPALATCAAP